MGEIRPAIKPAPSDEGTIDMTAEDAHEAALPKIRSGLRKEAVCGRAASFGKIVLTAALTAMVSNVVMYRMWLSQQDRIQAWNSRPIVEVKIEALKDRKDLTIRNLGRIDISDVKVFLTVYECPRD